MTPLALADVLRRVQREVGVTQEVGSGVRVLSRRRDADARATRDLVAGDVHRLSERGEEATGGGVGRRFVDDVREQHRELIAAKSSRHAVVRSAVAGDEAAQPVTDGAE